MVEYGIKTITTNPTLITKTDEIIKLVDTRSKQTRAFVLPSSYAPLVEKLVQELENKKWLQEKKKLLSSSSNEDTIDEELMEFGIKTMQEYLE